MVNRVSTTRTTKASHNAISGKLLHWYEEHARTLPWRTGPKDRARGSTPDPYAVWLSEIMLQQTTVATVTPRFGEFLTRWPTASDLAAAPLDDVLGAWAGLGYYARARNLHRCAQAITSEYGGVFPDTEEALRALPGIGAYTAAAIASIAFDRHAIVIDGNVERVTARLCALDAPIKKAKRAIREYAEGYWPAKRSGDFAQALMDLGATICTPRSPHCQTCPISSECKAFQKGTPEAYPLKAPKQAKPTRYGAAFLLMNDAGEVLFERRPDNGLLGGMLGLPGTEWTGRAPDASFAKAPEKGRWRLAGQARHTFTHFHLILDVFKKHSRHKPQASEIWLAPDAARLPTVMKKALDVGL